MKRIVVGVAVVACVLASGFFIANPRSSGVTPSAAVRSEAVPTTSVEVLAEHPDRFAGRVRVRGIVGRLAAERQMFSLVDLSDKEELLKTGATQCVTLPVRWTGAMPAAMQEIAIEGSVQQTEGKLLFVATTVQSFRAQESK